MILNLHQPSSGKTIQFVKDRDEKCLTSDQARYVYKGVEKDSIVNVEIIKQEIEEDRLDKENYSKEKNPYQSMNINDFESIKANINVNPSQKQ